MPSTNFSCFLTSVSSRGPKKASKGPGNREETESQETESPESKLGGFVPMSLADTQPGMSTRH